MLNLCPFNFKEINFKYLLDTSMIFMLSGVLKSIIGTRLIIIIIIISLSNIITV